METIATLDKTSFQKNINGHEAGLWILNNDKISCAITNYGARLVSLIVKDKEGNDVDVIAGFDSIDKYMNAEDPYYGAVLGRYANRIAGGTFTLHLLGDKVFHLDKNDGNNTLHGGAEGFHSKFWDVVSANDQAIVLHYFSKDMEGGFPGNLDVEVQYSLDGDTLKIEFAAKTDQMTVLNLSTHPYFNLNGEGSGTILNHVFEIDADTYIPVNSAMIPTGQIADVTDTPFDFMVARPLSDAINSNNNQLSFAEGGFDHTFVLDFNPEEPDVIVKGDKSGIIMEVFTEEPGIHLYTGQKLTGKDIGRGGKSYGKQQAFALEPQHFPDTPHHTNFPSAILSNLEVYRSATRYKFRSK